jgi:hypothetical protein
LATIIAACACSMKTVSNALAFAAHLGLPDLAPTLEVAPHAARRHGLAGQQFPMGAAAGSGAISRRELRIFIDCGRIALAYALGTQQRGTPMVTLVPEIVPGINRLTWLGWAVIALGALAILAPLLAGKATVILVGSILLIAGLAPSLR